MQFSYLLSGVAVQACGGDAQVTGITHFAGDVKPGSVYVALVGQRADGHDYIPEAINRGASGIVATRQVTLPPHIAWAVVEDGRLALAELAAKFFGYPSRRLRVIGVTGTNGKTTTTYLIKSILRQAGRTVGLIGTVQVEVGERVLPVKFTTPEAPELQALLKHMADMGASHAVMEVSSHALAMRRVASLDYTTAVFTNLTQDHLDFHGTMENYYQAKAKLFTEAQDFAGRTAVVNVDDAYGERLAKVSRGQVLSFGLAQIADIHATAIQSNARGSSFVLHTPWGEREVAIVTPGAHSIYNALAAAGASLVEGASLEDVERGLRLSGVPGRMEPIDEGQQFAVLVDYAHSPDGLENVLRAVKDFVHGKIILVFGCGGDRDRGKRPLMGEIACRYADVVVITSDNPRSEDPLEIIGDILAGISRSEGSDGLKVEPDRRKAIRLAIALADKGDVVLIAGKGHETTQTTRAGVSHFDDREEARSALRACCRD
ncbi:MAG: UDP-N-acetylmuramoyl-L-alanyl-D-glutamate--2,6-diaminopimelate ligase [Selenomonadales bacterium]|nr:UDP-N-acetylmuramoyl-L-alanyl-D-glutamate--2,6-diaminopimelate ligase [Selenomonadales bacterium]